MLPKEEQTPEMGEIKVINLNYVLYAAGIIVLWFIWVVGKGLYHLIKGLF